MTVVCDASAAVPDPLALKAANIDGIIHYATRFPLSAQEITDTLAAGLSVTMVMESGSQPALGGYAAGANDARAANARASAVGYDQDAWIYYVAEDPIRLDPSQWPTVDAYFAGVASVGGRPVGAYGGLLLVQHLLDTRLATKGWVVRNWGGTNANVHLAQEMGGVPAQFANMIDIDTVLQADFGQMPRPSGDEVTPADVTLIQTMLRAECAPGGEVYGRIIQACNQAIAENSALIVADVLTALKQDCPPPAA